MMDDAADPLLPVLADAVCLLLEYVAQRPDDASADDDVKALESAAYILNQVAPEDRERLVGLLGAKHSRAVGLVE